MKKSKLFLILAITIILTAGTTSLLLPRFLNQKAESLPPKEPACYLDKEENLKSVTQIVGERSCILEQVYREGTGSVSSNDAASLTEPSPADDSMQMVYRYYPSPDTDMQDDISKYMDYLVSEKQFLDITSVSSAVPDAVPVEANDGSVSVYRLAGPSVDSSSCLAVTIRKFSDSYTVLPQKLEEPWNTYVSKIWADGQKETQKSQHSTLDAAERSVASASSGTLGLTGDRKQYTFIADRGITLYGNQEYYQVNAYRQNQNGTLDYVCTYLLDPYTDQIAYRCQGTSDPIPMQASSNAE